MDVLITHGQDGIRVCSNWQIRRRLFEKNLLDIFPPSFFCLLCVPHAWYLLHNVRVLRTLGQASSNLRDPDHARPPARSGQAQCLARHLDTQIPSARVATGLAARTGHHLGWAWTLASWRGVPPHAEASNHTTFTGSEEGPRYVIRSSFATHSWTKSCSGWFSQRSQLVLWNGTPRCVQV